MSTLVEKNNQSNLNNTNIKNIDTNQIDWSDKSADIAMSIGKKCELCKTLDFLPFDCKYCSKSFCLDHRTVTSHRCENDPDKKIVPIIIRQADIKPKPKYIKCCDSKCKNLIENTILSLMMANCKKCGKTRCSDCRIYHKCK